MGPTASGKTALSIALARAINGEIISVDSALVYQNMDIGTAKPTTEERQGIPHWLIDIRTPEQSYSVADFIVDANDKVRDILNRGKVPILVGGTMLYFNALINGISNIPSSDDATRLMVRNEISQNGLTTIYDKLSSIDPSIIGRIHQNDKQRLTRAYEVYLATGKTLSYWQSQKRPGLAYLPIQFSLLPQNRDKLHQDIAARFDEMLDQGFVEEVKFLLHTYRLNPDLSSMRTVGYRQAYAYLRNEDDLNSMRDKAIAATRQLAKRQFTWLRGWPDVNELIAGDENNLWRIIEKSGATC